MAKPLLETPPNTIRYLIRYTTKDGGKLERTVIGESLAMRILENHKRTDPNATMVQVTPEGFEIPFYSLEPVEFVIKGALIGTGTLVVDGESVEISIIEAEGMTAIIPRSAIRPSPKSA